jgi:hypothetical protein
MPLKQPSRKSVRIKNVTLRTKLQFMGTTPIFAIFCVVIARVIALDERSLEYVLFLLGRNFSPRYAPSKFHRNPFLLIGLVRVVQLYLYP